MAKVVPITTKRAKVAPLGGAGVLLPTEDPEEYEQHVSRYFAQYDPSGEAERESTLSLAQMQWRRNRIAHVEGGLFALGLVEFGSQFVNEDPAVRRLMIDAHTAAIYKAQFKTLKIQDSRLSRRYKAELAQLTKLQADRRKMLAHAAPARVVCIRESEAASTD